MSAMRLAYQTPRSLIVTWVVAFGIMLGTAVLPAAAASANPAAELQVPPGFHRVLEQAIQTSPYLAELELELQIVESVYRQNNADRYGMQSGVTAPVALSSSGALGGVEFQLRQGMGNARLDGSFGLGAHYDWDDEDGLRIAPAGRVGVTYPLGQGPDAAELSFYLKLLEGHLDYIQGRQAWERNLFSAYGAWQSALRKVEAAEKRVALEEERLKAIQVREEDGGTAAMAVHEATQQLLAAQDQYEEAQFAAENALRALQRLIGSEADSSVLGAFAPGVGESSRRVGFSGPEAAPQTLEDWMALARGLRGEIALAEARVELAKQELARAQAQAGITGELTSDVAYRPKSNGEWEFAWQAGVVWQLPVRDVVRSEAVVQAELNVAKAEAALQAAIEEVEDAVWEAYRKVELALRRVERLEDQVAHAEFLLELAQNRLKAGLTARVTVLEAEWVLATTENALADAERELGLAILSLWHAAGKDVTW